MRSSLCHSCRKLRRRLNDGSFSNLTLEEEFEHPLVYALIRDSLEAQLQGSGGCDDCIANASNLSAS